MKLLLRTALDLTLLVPQALFASIACGGNASQSGGDGDFDASSSSGGASGGSASGGSGSGGSPETGGAPGSGGQSFEDYCVSLHIAAGTRFYQERWLAGLGCTSDDECQWITGLDACFDHCRVLSGPATEGLQAAVDEVCQDARTQGCPEGPRPCLAVDDELRCVDGVCGAYRD